MRSDDVGPYSLEALQALAEPQLFTTDPVTLKARYVAWFEAASGRKLYPMQIEMLLIDLLAYAMSILGTEGQIVVRQHLVALSDEVGLTLLATNRSTPRLDASRARTTVRFALAAARSTAVAIPAGTTVSAGAGGALTFETAADVVIAAGAVTVDVTAACSVAGEAGNGLDVGALTTIEDLSIVGLTVRNITATAGGADQEAIEPWRLRVANALAKISGAGPRKGYRETVFAVSPAIVDVAVIRPAPCEIEIYALTAVGPAGPELKAAILAALDPEDVRPQGDDVSARDATAAHRSIAIHVRTTGALATTLAAATTAAAKVVGQWTQVFAPLIEPSAIEAAVKAVAGVVDVDVSGIAFGRLGQTQYLVVDALTVEPEVFDG